ncbi:IS630 family transposase ISMno19 [Methylobacterium isbiliense]|uniref:IS630 family transposase ISMno19 n=1 Tax=Methylobacterium isbiliense TaxID=315478 RepID=A0ABQ4SE40_9HYPH|nr:IS630 family transposase ISMno19 [Methylobacterium isbiliense]
MRSSERSTDFAFAEKVEAIVGLSMDPSRHAVVLSMDEKSQMQPPGAPGPAARSRLDDRLPAPTTLCAALNVLEGTVIGRCMQPHRHEEFLRFLNAVEGVASALSRRRLRRGPFTGIVDRQAAINRTSIADNERPGPFVWAKPAAACSTARLHQPSESVHRA